jgi:hypothetical protein
VLGPAVQFEDHLLLGIQRVDLVAVDGGVDDRDRETVLGEPGDEDVLKP